MQKLEQEIGKLTQSELSAFRKWFVNCDSDQWGGQIEEDALSGKLDRPAQKALADQKAGKKHSASLDFWSSYHRLPKQELAAHLFEEASQLNRLPKPSMSTRRLIIVSGQRMYKPAYSYLHFPSFRKHWAN
jgi:hypothetical protein